MRLHPSNASITVGPEGEECTIYPATYIPLGECVVVDGFEVRRFSEHYACTCPAWRYAADVAVSKRTCDHLTDVLGALYEKERTKEEVSITLAYARWRIQAMCGFLERRPSEAAPIWLGRSSSNICRPNHHHLSDRKQLPRSPCSYHPPLLLLVQNRITRLLWSKVGKSHRN